MVFTYVGKKRLEKSRGTDTNQNILANIEHLAGSEAELYSSQLVVILVIVQGQLAPPLQTQRPVTVLSKEVAAFYNLA